jgi:hypothetical protein
MRDYSKLDIFEMFRNCRTLDEIILMCETLKWLWALGENISFDFVRDIASKRTRELI